MSPNPAGSPNSVQDSHIAKVRRFNRFYTRRIGVLQEGYSGGAFSLAEARVLYEIGRRGKAIATDIARELGLDAGYLSRILKDGLNYVSRYARFFVLLRGCACCHAV